MASTVTKQSSATDCKTDESVVQNLFTQFLDTRSNAKDVENYLKSACTNVRHQKEENLLAKQHIHLNRVTRPLSFETRVQSELERRSQQYLRKMSMRRRQQLTRLPSPDFQLLLQSHPVSECDQHPIQTSNMYNMQNLQPPRSLSPDLLLSPIENARHDSREPSNCLLLSTQGDEARSTNDKAAV